MLHVRFNVAFLELQHGSHRRVDRAMCNTYLSGLRLWENLNVNILPARKGCTKPRLESVGSLMLSMAVKEAKKNRAGVKR